ncbi:FAD/NAD(P)-binding domain-containing protein [Stipitochalara longipes BDJ]|nr:FAD/NAD(P)-binding domain-containing protein [Stipitochalara longipes BDJ]
MQFRVLIVGAGPAGLIAAHALHQAGINFTILERRPNATPQLGGTVGLFPQSVRILNQLGLMQPLEALSVGAVNKTNIDIHTGKVMGSSPIFSIMKDIHGYPVLALFRRDLVEVLYNHLPERETRVRFNSSITDIETGSDGVTVHLEDGSTERGSMVIGADGAYSKTRSVMQRLIKESSPKPFDTTNENTMLATFQSLVGYGPNIDGLETETFFEGHGKNITTLISPKKDGVVFFVLRPLPKPTKSGKKYTFDDAAAMARDCSSLFVAPNVKFEQLWALQKSAVLVNQEEGLAPKWHWGRIVCLGDSVHKMTSISALGLNTAIQDDVVLVNELRSLLHIDPNPSTNALEKAFLRYYSTRLEDTKKALADSALVVRAVTWSSWFYQFLDQYVLRLLGDPLVFRLVAFPTIQKGQILDFVHIKDDKNGIWPWKASNPVE